MIVVSDTSPLNYLVLIEAEHCLPELFGAVIVPPAVLEELQRIETPPRVRAWASEPPTWLSVRSPTGGVGDFDLDLGESEAITLSLEIRADAVLMDDRKGRAVAARAGLKPVGLVTVLELAAARGVVDLREAVTRLQATSFRGADWLYESALERDRARRES